MYTFRTATDLDAFEAFVKNNGGQYLQSAKWPQVKLDWKPYFYAGFNGEECVLTALILERSVAAAKLWYCPAGAVCDYGNTDLLKEFTAFMSAEMKKAGVAALFFDPCVTLRKNGETDENGIAVHNNLLQAGFQLQPDAAACIYKAPWQLMTALRDENGNAFTEAQMLKKLDKGVRYSVRIGEQRGLCWQSFGAQEAKANPQILEDFADIMRDTGERNDFLERNEDYVLRLMQVFGKEEMELTLVYYDKNKDEQLQNERLAKKEKLLKDLETAPEKKIRGIKEEIESIDKQTGHYEERRKETADIAADKIAVAGGLTVHYNGLSSCLFGGAKNLLRNNFRSSHYLNYIRLCKSMELSNEFHDLGYVLPKKTEPTADGLLAKCEPREDFEGILAFKKSFGADEYEYIGEYVLVGSKAAYLAYTKLMPTAKKVKKTVFAVLRKGR